MAENDKNEKLNSRISKFFNEARQFIDTKRGKWEEYEDFYDGRHWKRASKRPKENIVFQLIESELPILTDGSPVPDLVPLEEQHAELADVLSASLKSELRYNNIILKRSQAIRNSLKTGTGWKYVDWDPDLDNGLGHVVIKVLDWRNVFVDPLASDIDDADFVGLKFPMRMDQVKRRFPGNDAKLDSEKGVVDGTFGDTDQVTTTEREKQWTGFNAGEMPRTNKLSIVEDTVILEEVWLKDYELEKVPEEDALEEIERENELFRKGINPECRKWDHHPLHMLGHTAELEEHHLALKSEAAEVMEKELEEITEEDIQGLMEHPEIGPTFIELDIQMKILQDHIETHNIWAEQNPDGKRPKYPNNYRLVVRVGSVILYDGKPPVDDGRVPLVPYYGYKNEESVYGTGEIQNILDQQKILNEISYLELMSLRKSANSGWIKDDNSGVSAAELTNEQGIVVTKKAGTEVTRIPPGETSQQFQIKMQDQRRAANDVMGLQDAVQGKRAAGVVAAAAHDTLKESNMVRIREKDRINIGYSDVRLGWLITSRIVKYWTNSRKVLLMDKNGELKRFDFEPDKIEDLKFDLMVTQDSLAGMDKGMLFSHNFQLLQAGVMDPVTFVESTDGLPNRAHLLKKVKENNDKDALIQQIAGENEELKAMVEELTGESLEQPTLQ